MERAILRETNRHEQQDFRKICIMNIQEDDTDFYIRGVCEIYGEVIDFQRPKKKLAFATYKMICDAVNAKEQLLNIGFHVGFAHLKTRNRQLSDNENWRSKDSSDKENWRLNGETDWQSSNVTGLDLDSDAPHYNERHYPDWRFKNQTSAQQQQSFGTCIRCRGPAYLNCGRCGDFYCSESCQMYDWLVHKRNCFTMPKLIQSPFHSSQSSSQCTSM